jgi:hypothetical protein
MKAVTAPSSGGSQDEHKYWLYGDNENQLLIHVRSDGLIRLDPVASLTQASDGLLHCEHVPWRAGLPLHLFEDPQLALHAGVDPSGWLSEWHTEREWLNAIHKTHYSVGVISVIEDLSPVAAYVPGPPGADPKWLEYERRRRELVQPDFQVFATDHWNFNVRFPNPGGNHGSFLRISTHSVWMMAGAGLPARRIEDPYDTLSFASTVLSLLGRKAPMPDRVVKLN